MSQYKTSALTIETGEAPSLFRPEYENYMFRPKLVLNQALTGPLSSPIPRQEAVTYANTTIRERLTKSAPAGACLPLFQGLRPTIRPPLDIPIPLPRAMNASKEIPLLQIAPDHLASAKGSRKRSKNDIGMEKADVSPELAVQGFGAIVVTRPHHRVDSSHQIYILNPSIVNEWAGTIKNQPIQEILRRSGDRSFQSPAPKVIEDAYELYLRNAPVKTCMDRESRNITNRRWTEPKTGNEFSIYSATWTL